MSHFRLLIPFFLIFFLVSPAQGQIPRSLSDSAEISLITILPGEPAYAAFGHSGLRVQDPAQDLDWMYSYGTFDFNDPLFIPKFTYGRLTYWLAVHSFPSALRHYRRQQRSVIEQVLNLNGKQRDALFHFLQTNALPSNRYYQYDFLFDNCSTRIRDALASALGASLQFADAPNPQSSFRHLLDPYVADRPWLDLGFDLVLGQPTDRVATPYEAMFLPRYLMLAFDEASLSSAAGSRPLVAQKDTVFWNPERDFAPEPAVPWPALLAWLFLGLGTIDVLWRVHRNGRGIRLLDATLYGAVGFAGFLMTFLWFVSEHYVTNWNWNLLWAWPTHLVAAWMLARGRTESRLLHRYLAMTAAAALVVTGAWLFWPQDLPTAGLPLTLLVAVRSGWHAYRHQSQYALSS